MNVAHALSPARDRPALSQAKSADNAVRPKLRLLGQAVSPATWPDLRGQLARNGGPPTCGELVRPGTPWSPIFFVMANG